MRRNRRMHRKKHRFTKLVVFMLIMTLFATAVVSIDKRLFPTVLVVADMQARNIINEIIYEAVSAAIDEHGVSSDDFYIMSSNEDGFVNSLAVNTVLVNDICGRIGAYVSGEFINLGRQKIKVPMGVLLGLDILAGHGPEYSVSLVPMGDAIVNYETKFESVGINQISFRVWVCVDTQIKIVNPLQSSVSVVSRKITLVDTVFGGRVPDSFFNNAPVSIPIK